MAIVVRIPTPLQKFTKQQSTVETTGITIHDMLEELGHHFPGLREQLCDERGTPRKFVNLSRNKPTVCLAATWPSENDAVIDGKVGFYSTIKQ
jgi:sulfur-carrier protein